MRAQTEMRMSSFKQLLNGIVIPLSVQLLYQFRLEYADKEAMNRPTLDIPDRGRLPDFVETFKVYLPCTGRKASEVDVLIQLNITSPTKRYNQTVLNFMRKKICLFGKFKFFFLLL